MIWRTLLSICLAVCPLGLARADDWPQWQGPDRTGLSKETGLLPSWPPGGPRLLWTFRDAGHGIAGMSVVGDRLYTMGAKGKATTKRPRPTQDQHQVPQPDPPNGKEYVYALDLKTQKKLWSTEVGPRYDYVYVNGPTSTPTLDGNFLYAIGALGNLVCVETTTGRKVWSRDLVKDLSGVWPTDTYTESPLIDGDLVIVTPGGKKGALAAFDKKTGTLKWRSTGFTSKGNNCNASMIAIEVGGVRQYVQVIWGNYVAGLRASDGKLLWKAECPSGYSYCTPVYRDDCVYVATDGGCKLLKLMLDGDKFKAEQIYAHKKPGVDCGGFVLVGEYLYIGSPDGWFCQNFQTGKIMWKEKISRDMGEASVVFADGNLYGYHQKQGDVLLIKATPEGYQEQGKFRIPQERPKRKGMIYTRPVVANGKLYLRVDDLIFCYDVRKPR